MSVALGLRRLALALLSLLLTCPTLLSAQCSYTGPFPASTYTFNLTLSNLTAATAPPLFATQLLASIDADLQSNLSPPPTASTLPDLQCGSLTSPATDNSSSSASAPLTAQLYILGTLALDTGATSLDALTQLLSDIRLSAFQQASGYNIDPALHVPVAQVCGDGSLLAVNSTAGCPNGSDESGGGGLAEGVVVDIVILILVVASIVLGAAAWKWLAIKQQKDRAEGRMN